MDQLAGGVHDNTNGTSDYKVIPTPPAPQEDIEVGTNHGSNKQ